jgi:hypothetical protein
LNIGLAVVNIRGVLGNGTVTLAGEVELTEGDVIGLFYIDDGLSITIDLGGGGAPIVWSIHRIA